MVAICQSGFLCEPASIISLSLTVRTVTVGTVCLCWLSWNLNLWFPSPILYVALWIKDTWGTGRPLAHFQQRDGTSSSRLTKQEGHTPGVTHYPGPMSLSLSGLSRHYPLRTEEGFRVVFLLPSVTKIDFLSIFPSCELSPMGNKSPLWNVELILISLPLSIITRGREESATLLCPKDDVWSIGKVKPMPTGPSSLLSTPIIGCGFHTEHVYRYLVLEIRLSGSQPFIKDALFYLI